jgi:hypothetical protein
VATLHEWSADGNSLREISWLIGTWTAKVGESEVRTTYEWDESKHFILVRFAIKDKERTLSGTQRIGYDPRSGQLRSWLFEDGGGFGEAIWARDGNRWVQTAMGVQADGSEMTATNILTPLGKDAFTWQSVDRKLDGEEVPNIAPVKVTRVK